MKTFSKYFFFLILLAVNCYAENVFGSLRSSETNVRVGPSAEYPIKYTYLLENMPVKILGEYDNWYRIKDKDDEEGWINKSLINKRRHLIVVNGEQIAYKKDTTKSSPLFRLEENVVVKFKKCNEGWCKIEVNGKNCWILAENVWGHE